MNHDLRRRLLSHLDEADGAALLHAFDAMVREDTGPAGFVGEVCIAVRGRQGYRFWRGSFGAETECGFVRSYPDSSQATLFLSSTEADSILLTGELPATRELLMFDGDRKLMKRFINRFTQKTDWIGIRMS